MTDAKIRHAVKQAHGFDFKVLLKPMLDPLNGDWRGHMKFPDDQSWAICFENYHAFMLHYTRLAAETRCETLALGCEMSSSVVPRFEGQWRSLVEKVRAIYPGVLTYNGNHDDITKISWWDAVDVISLGAYFPAGKGADSTVEEMMESWVPIRAHLARDRPQVSKAAFFIEIGITSTRGMGRSPSKCCIAKADPALEERARYYEAAIRAIWDEPWFQGYFWWKWDTVLSRPETSSVNTEKATVIGENGFRIVDKPAEGVVRQWFAKPRVIPGK